MSADPLKVGVIGFGYWGPNLVRNFTAHPTTTVTAVAELDAERREAAGRAFPHVRRVASAEEVIGDPEIEAIAVATPMHTHHPLAKAAIEAGEHVLVEKPLGGSVAECEELQKLAAARGVQVMVDHTFVYTGAVKKIRELVEAGELGEILYFDSVRINLGLFQPDFNVVWDLAPHDLSILDFVLGREAQWVSAIGVKHYGEHENLAYMTIGFGDKLIAHVHCSWFAPVKTRKIIIAGTERMLVYDDTNPAERVKLYETGVDVEHMRKEQQYRMNVQYRTGNVLIPKLDPSEALRLVVSEFERSCRTGEPSASDIGAGLRVVRMLEAAQRSISNQGERVAL